jgi:hypothetical protein
VNLDKIDPNFVKDLLASDLAVWVVARKLRLSGFDIFLPAIKIRPDVSQIQEFGDSGDLIIGSSIIEVKQRPDLDFNSLKEFPYESIIVDTTGHYDALKIPPAYYIICNRSLDGGAIINTQTKPQWQVSRRWDNKRKRERTFYICPKELCNYWDFREVPRFKFE